MAHAVAVLRVLEADPLPQQRTPFAPPQAVGCGPPSSWPYFMCGPHAHSRCVRPPRQAPRKHVPRPQRAVLGTGMLDPLYAQGALSEEPSRRSPLP